MDLSVSSMLMCNVNEDCPLTKQFQKNLILSAHYFCVFCFRTHQVTVAERTSQTDLFPVQLLQIYSQSDLVSSWLTLSSWDRYFPEEQVYFRKRSQKEIKYWVRSGHLTLHLLPISERCYQQAVITGPCDAVTQTHNQSSQHFISGKAFVPMSPCHKQT